MNPARRAALGSLLLALVACVAQTGGEQREVASARPDAQVGDGACAPAGDEALALLDGGAECPISLEVDGDALRLLAPGLGPGLGHTGDEPEPLAVGPAPASCGPALALCSFEGRVTKRGPIVIASERGPESEMPTQVHIGWVVDERLVFAPSWHGPSSVANHTRIGPAYALAPFDCDGALQLLPTPRLPEAEVESVPADLAALAGAWTVDDAGEAIPPVTPSGRSPSDCEALLGALP